MKKIYLLFLFFILISLKISADIDKSILDNINNSVYEVIVKKIEYNNITYAEKLPLDQFSYAERNDKYYSIETCFSVGKNLFLSCAHVFNLDKETFYNDYNIRNKQGKVFEIDQIYKYSNNKDFILFSVKNNDNDRYLETDENFELNTSIYAVGNALGEGIIIRDGILTSLTKESDNGEWDYFRFSAAASPGNTGGPLINNKGKVIGIIAKKSENENLNYAIPISLINSFKNNAAIIKNGFSFTYFLCSMKMDFSDIYETKLPKNIAILSKELIDNYNKLLDAFFKKYFNENKNYLFPYSPLSKSLILDPPISDFPLIATENTDSSWSLTKPKDISETKSDDCNLKIGDLLSVTFFSYEKSKAINLNAFLDSPDLLLNDILKKTNTTRTINQTNIRILSLGKAYSTESFTDKYGRTWKKSLWKVDYCDSSLVMVYLPCPTGFQGFYYSSASSGRYMTEKSLVELTNFVYVSYLANISEWNDFLKIKNIIPESLKKLNINNNKDNINIDFGEVSITLSKSDFNLSDDSYLDICNGLFEENHKFNQEIKSFYIFSNTNNNKVFYCEKFYNPKSLKNEDYIKKWNNIINCAYPYDNYIIEDNEFNKFFKTRFLYDKEQTGIIEINFAYLIGISDYSKDDYFYNFKLLEKVNNNLTFSDNEIFLSNNKITQKNFTKPESKIDNTTKYPLNFSLALSAINCIQNSYYYDNLLVLSNNKDSKNEIISSLKRNWKIKNRDDYFKKLITLKAEGLSKEIYHIIKINLRNTEDKHNEIESSQINFLNYFNTFISDDKLIYGYDYTRIITLSREAYQADYISEKEALENINWATNQISAKFSSWEDFGVNYILGSIYSDRDDDDLNKLIRKLSLIYYKLFDNKSGLWTKTKWSDKDKNNKYIINLEFIEKYKKDAEFINAINNEDINTLDLLLSKNLIYKKCYDYYDNLPLISAINNESLKVVEYLLSKGFDVDSKTSYGASALMLAMTKVNKKLVDLILKYNPSLIIRSDYNSSVFMYAIRYNFNDIVKKLIDKQSEINSIDSDGWIPLDFAIRYNNDNNLIKIILEKTIEINHKDNDNWTPLLYAIRYDKEIIAKILVEKITQLNDKTNDGWTPLLMASRYNQMQIVKILIEKGVNVNIGNKNDYTPLMALSEFGNLEVIKLIIDKGASINFSKDNKWTALMFAAYAGNNDIVKYLLSKGADKYMKNDVKLTASDIAKNNNHPETAKVIDDY